MYCEECGKSVRDDAKFCPYCGASVFSQSINGTGNNNAFMYNTYVSSYHQKNKKRNKKLLIIPIVSIVLIASIILTITIVKDFNKSKRELLVSHVWSSNGGYILYEFTNDGHFIRHSFSSTYLGDDNDDSTDDHYYHWSEQEGVYTIDDEELYIKYDFGGETYHFKNLNGEDVRNGILNIKKSEWYLDSEFLVFDGDCYRTLNKTLSEHKNDILNNNR